MSLAAVLSVAVVLMAAVGCGDDGDGGGPPSGRDGPAGSHSSGGSEGRSTPSGDYSPGGSAGAAEPPDRDSLREP
jgi:hypothetical protein